MISNRDRPKLNTEGRLQQPRRVSLPEGAFELPKLPAMSGDMGKLERKVILSVCSRPELLPLARSVTFKVVSDLEEPFRVPSADLIVVDRRSLRYNSVASLFIRFALELALWQKTIRKDASLGFFVGIGILAGRAARLYWKTLIEGEREVCRQHVPKEFSGFLEMIETWDWQGLVEQKPEGSLDNWVKPLLRLQDMDNVCDDVFSEQVLGEAQRLIRQGICVAAPLDYLLTTGGDDRLKLNSESGLNGYGCSPKPRPWAITFASTTASSISDYAFREAEKLRQRLIEAACQGIFDSRYSSELERIRSEIVTVLDLKHLHGLELILTTSGTDAEFLALFFALCHCEEPVANILVGPEETGSGVSLAASGRHFATDTPLGKPVLRGEAVEGIPTDRVRLLEVPIRNYEGTFLPAETVDSRVRTLVNKSITDGCRVLLHLVDSSKTGIVAPSIERITQLKDRYGSSLDVVVDACQLRTGKKKLQRYLELGFMVMITGSKFYTGPPFSGALIVPSQIADRVDLSRTMPSSFGDYFTCHEFPSSWSSLASHLSRKKNIGLLLRWQAALWEMKAFRAVSDKHKYLILVLFGESMREVISSNPDLNLISVPSTGRWKLPDGHEWDWLPTIFTFTMLSPASHGQRRPLFMHEVKKIYHYLNMDISSLIPPEASEEERQLAGKRCHIGQPVKVSCMGENWIGALRVSAGARLVSGVCFDPQLGRHFAQRSSREIGDACGALDKISLIIKYMNYIEQFDGLPQPRNDAEPAYIV